MQRRGRHHDHGFAPIDRPARDQHHGGHDQHYRGDDATIPVTTTTSRPIDVTVQAGRVAGPDRFDYSVGDEVSVWLLSDIADEIHVHGYDVFVAAQAGVPIEIALTADAPGIFEVELESSHTLLFELEVTP